VFSFAGVSRRSVVAVSAVGVRQTEYRHFEHGFREMVERIQPSRVLCYGRLRRELGSLIDVRCYPTRWEGIKRAVGSDDGR